MIVNGVYVCFMYYLPYYVTQYDRGGTAAAIAKAVLLARLINPLTLPNTAAMAINAVARVYHPSSSNTVCIPNKSIVVCAAAIVSSPTTTSQVYPEGRRCHLEVVTDVLFIPVTSYYTTALAAAMVPLGEGKEEKTPTPTVTKVQNMTTTQTLVH